VIFLDTSAVYALADKADPHHVAACTEFDLALRSGETFLLHNYILVESVALLQTILSVINICASKIFILFNCHSGLDPESSL